MKFHALVRNVTHTFTLIQWLKTRVLIYVCVYHIQRKETATAPYMNEKFSVRINYKIINLNDFKMLSGRKFESFIPLIICLIVFV